MEFLGKRPTDEIREDVPVEPGRIYLNVWNGGAFLHGWAGPFQLPGSPIVAEIERVAFTADGKPCQFPGSLACQLAKGE